MRKLILITCAATAAFLVNACAPVDNKPAANYANTGNANANSNAAQPVAAAPTAAALLALENKAFEAWKSKDGKHFEGFLTTNFVSFEGGKRATKAEQVKMISEGNCDVKNLALSDEKMTPVGPDAAVLTVKATADATCDGQKLPSPMLSTTLYVREGNDWKAAYHNQVAIIDPKAPPPPPAKPIAAKPADTKPADAKPIDALTDTLMAVEKKGWEAWKVQDAKVLQETTTAGFGFVDPTGKMTSPQAEVIKMWTTAKCEIKSAGPADGMATSISPTVAILTYRGNAEGTCDGQKLENSWNTTIFLKEGDAWKAAYIFQTLA